MDKTNPPETFGVFKPVGHTVITYRTALDLQQATALLATKGFTAAALIRYSPEEMIAQVDAELETVGFLASFGYELDLMKANRALALEGCSFLIVHAPDADTAELVAEVAKSSNAVAAQHYGTFMIQEILTPMPGAK